MNEQNQVDAEQHTSQTRSSQTGNATQEKELSPPLPQGRHSPRQKGLKGEVYLPTIVEVRSHWLVCLLGYGLLVFAAFDYIHIIFPPRFTDPAWELQTIGQMVEHSPVPLLGLMFVFYRHKGYIAKREKILLGFLSWVALLVGLLYLLMLPLGAANTWRIYQRNNAQIAAQLAQQSQQFQQLKGQIQTATTDKQLKQLVASLTPQGATPQIQNPQAFKEQLLARISQAQQDAQAQANTTRSTQRLSLLKNSLKWNLGALISGTLFIGIWHLTNWARKNLSKIKK